MSGIMSKTSRRRISLDQPPGHFQRSSGGAESHAFLLTFVWLYIVLVSGLLKGYHSQLRGRDELVLLLPGVL